VSPISGSRSACGTAISTLINVNRVLVETLTPGQRVADQLAIVMGSWTFMIVQSIILAARIALNVVAWMRH